MAPHAPHLRLQSIPHALSADGTSLTNVIHACHRLEVSSSPTTLPPSTTGVTRVTEALMVSTNSLAEARDLRPEAVIPTMLYRVFRTFSDLTRDAGPWRYRPRSPRRRI
jgi:hypothetical protein